MDIYSPCLFLTFVVNKPSVFTYPIAVLGFFFCLFFCGFFGLILLCAFSEMWNLTPMLSVAATENLLNHSGSLTIS